MADLYTTEFDSREAPTQRVVVLQALHAAPRRVAAVAQPLPTEAHDWRPADDAWSVRMLAAHLAAGEAPFLLRMQTILADNTPWLPYFGPDVARPDAPDNLADLLAQFRDGRDTLMRLLLNLQPADWQRPAVHETQGPTTLALQAQNIANHDADHLQQLNEAVRAWEQRRHA